MVEAIEILRNVEGIRFCYFDEGDVVRHHLVQRIIRAYDDYKGRNEQLSLSLEAKNGNGFAAPQQRWAGALRPASSGRHRWRRYLRRKRLLRHKIALPSKFLLP